MHGKNSKTLMAYSKITLCNLHIKTSKSSNIYIYKNIFVYIYIQKDHKIIKLKHQIVNK
jgi:hypothetical protein